MIVDQRAGSEALILNKLFAFQSRILEDRFVDRNEITEYPTDFQTKQTNRQPATAGDPKKKPGGDPRRPSMISPPANP